MNHTEFFNVLKNGNIPHVLLFHGEEEYVKEQALRDLKTKYVPDFQDLNITVFDTATADDIISASDTAPFMADARINICRFLPKDKDSKRIIEYFPRLPQETVLIFCIRGKADTKTSIYKKIKDDGGEVFFDFLPEDEAAKWVVQTTLKSGCTINPADARFLIQLVGKDLLSIKNELGKLCDYVGEGGVITRQIIPDIVIKNLEFQLYNTYSYFINGKMQDGFRSLENITNGKDKDQESFGIAGYFLSCLKAALSAHDLMARRASQQEMERVTGKRGYALRDLCNTAKKFTRQQLLGGIRAFAEVSYTRIVLGNSSYNALYDAIIKTFGR